MAQFKAGDAVAHAWGHPGKRPGSMTEERVTSYGFHLIGSVVGVNGDLSTATSQYWDVSVNGRIVQWREDLMSLVS